MSKFYQELNTIDSHYLQSQSLDEGDIESDSLLDHELAAAVRHTYASRPSDLKKLMRHKMPLLFLVEFLGAPEKSSTWSTREQILQRWIAPQTARPNYTGAKERAFYMLLWVFAASVLSAVVFSVIAYGLFGVWSVIGLLTIILFAVISDVSSWWRLRLSVPTVASVSVGGNTLAEKVREAIAAKKDLRKSLSYVEPSEAHLLTHWNGYELRALLSADETMRKMMWRSVPPSFAQMQLHWATQCSYPLYLLHMMMEVFPYAWMWAVYKLNRRLP